MEYVSFEMYRYVLHNCVLASWFRDSSGAIDEFSLAQDGLQLETAKHHSITPALDHLR